MIRPYVQHTCISRYIGRVLSFSDPSRFGISSLKPNMSKVLIPNEYGWMHK